MLRKSNRPHRKAKQDKFQFELLEPRHLFSVSGGSAPAIEHMTLEDDMSFEHHAEMLEESEPSAGTQADQALTNFLYLPMVNAGPNASVNAFATLQLNAEVIVNIESNLTKQWSKLSGPGTATFGNAQQEKTTVQFNQAGTYVLQLAATNNGVTALSQLTVNVAAVNVVNIDQAWLNARGDGPYYLDQQGKTYVLQTDVTTDGTAFAIIAKDVTFDLNGHTITYDNAAPIVIPNGSFEQGSGSAATGWNFANAPNASRYQGVWLNNETYDGDYSLKFNNTVANQYVTSTSTITLEANTTYSLSAMFEYGGKGTAGNPGAKGFVRLVGNGLPTQEVSFNGTNYRGIQLQEQAFTTGNTAVTYSVQVGIVGQATSTQPFYIDDIKIQRTKAYGVTTQVQGWSPTNYPGMSQGGIGTNATVKNGKIVQGADDGTFSHGVFLHEVAGVALRNLDITVHGANSSTILGLDQGVAMSMIDDNVLTSNVKTITSRDNFDGAVIKGISGVISNNNISNGVHAGIAWTSNSDIYGNTIQLKSKYTNGFAIASGPGSKIHDNIINCGSGDYAARGIAASGSPTSPTEVYNNTIHVQVHRDNQEYEGEPIGGAYGIQLENAKNVEVRNNSVYAYGNETLAYAFRLNSDEGTTDSIYVHDNLFKAISNGSSAASTKFSGIDFQADRVIFENNRLETNDGLVGASNDSAILIKGSVIAINTPVQNSHTIETEYSGSSGVHLDVKFLDTTFADAAARSFLENGQVRSPQRYGGSVDSRGRFSLAWTTTLAVKDNNNSPVAGASAVLKDKLGAVAASGSTGVQGSFTAIVTQQATQGEARTLYNNYTASASMGGNSQQQAFTADKVQTLTVQLGASQQSLNQASDEDIARLALQAFLAQRFATRQVSEVSDVAEGGELNTEVLNEEQALEVTSTTTVQASTTAYAVGVNNATSPEAAVDEVHTRLVDFLSRRALARQVL